MVDAKLTTKQQKRLNKKLNKNSGTVVRIKRINPSYWDSDQISAAQWDDNALISFAPKGELIFEILRKRQCNEVLSDEELFTFSEFQKEMQELTGEPWNSEPKYLTEGRAKKLIDAMVTTGCINRRTEEIITQRDTTKSDEDDCGSI